MIYLKDRDVTILHADVLDGLRSLEPESVQCVAHVARKHGRHSILIELNEEYCELAARRLAQQSLLTELA